MPDPDRIRSMRRMAVSSFRRPVRLVLLAGLGWSMALGTVLLAGRGSARAAQSADSTEREIAPPDFWNARAQKRAAPAAKTSRRPYEGLWASSKKACRAEDGVDRVSIEGDRFHWYETRCRAHDIKAANQRSWTMRMACEGEGEKFRAKPRLSLNRSDTLVFEAAPVGPTKRQVYVRCDGGRGEHRLSPQEFAATRAGA